MLFLWKSLSIGIHRPWQRKKAGHTIGLSISAIPSSLASQAIFCSILTFQCLPGRKKTLCTLHSISFLWLRYLWFQFSVIFQRYKLRHTSSHSSACGFYCYMCFIKVCHRYVFNLHIPRHNIFVCSVSCSFYSKDQKECAQILFLAQFTPQSVFTGHENVNRLATFLKSCHIFQLLCVWY